MMILAHRVDMKIRLMREEKIQQTRGSFFVAMGVLHCFGDPNPLRIPGWSSMDGEVLISYLFCAKSRRLGMDGTQGIYGREMEGSSDGT